jgi:hypothetical protein
MMEVFVVEDKAWIEGTRQLQSGAIWSAELHRYNACEFDHQGRLRVSLKPNQETACTPLSNHLNERTSRHVSVTRHKYEV